MYNIYIWLCMYQKHHPNISVFFQSHIPSFCRVSLACNKLIITKQQDNKMYVRKHSPTSSSRSSQTRPTPPWPLRSENTHRTLLRILATELSQGEAFRNMLYRVPFDCNLSGLRNWHDQERCFARDSLFENVWEAVAKMGGNFSKVMDVNLVDWMAKILIEVQDPLAHVTHV